MGTLPYEHSFVNGQGHLKIPPSTGQNTANETKKHFNQTEPTKKLTSN